MKVGTGFGGGWLTGVAEQIRLAEELGYDFASAPETQHDSMLGAALAAANSSNIEIQTSVTIAFPRSPTVLAMEAWDIQHLSQRTVRDRPRFAGEGPQPAPLQHRVARRPGHPHEGIHTDAAGGLEILPDRRKARVHRQVLPLHADDAELQPRPDRLPAPESRPRAGRRRHGARRRRSGGHRHAARLHDRQVHARRCPAERRHRPQAQRPRPGKTSRSPAAASPSSPRRNPKSNRGSSGSVSRFRSTVQRAATTKCSKSTA